MDQQSFQQWKVDQLIMHTSELVHTNFASRDVLMLSALRSYNADAVIGNTDMGVNTVEDLKRKESSIFFWNI